LTATPKIHALVDAVTILSSCHRIILSKCVVSKICCQQNDLSVSELSRQRNAFSANWFHVDDKHERRRVASLPVSSIFKNCNKLTLKQYLVHYTSVSGSLKFGMIIIIYFLVAPKFIQSCFKYVIYETYRKRNNE